MAVKDSYRAEHDPREPLAQNEAEPPFSWRAALEIVQALALAVIISVVLNLFVVQVTEVRQRSMESTLLQADRVLVSKVDYRFGTPQRGDIVVFQPTTDSTIPYVKRVAAVAGDTIELRDGDLYVNGTKTDYPGAPRRHDPAIARVGVPVDGPRRQLLCPWGQPHGLERLAVVRPAARGPDHRKGDPAVLAVRSASLLRVVRVAV